MPSEQFDAPTDELLFRFIAEQCAASERGVVEGWLRRDPANVRRLDDLRRIWLASRPAPLRDVDRMWTRLRAAAEQGGADRRAASPRSQDGDRGRPVPRAASLQWSARTFTAATRAAAVVVLAASAALFISFSRVSRPRRAVAAPRIYATGPAQTANVRLRDGTRVTLAPASRLTVPDDFGTSARSVSIDGEGYFDVVHDAAHPFQVRARETLTEDIGTRFDMRAYADDPEVVVIVSEGAVTVGRFPGDSAAQRGGVEGAVVRRGERARAGGRDSTITVDRVSLKQLGWIDGQLSFVKTPLAEIARTIGRWYDLDVRVADAALAKRLITADFDTQSPKEMIGALATAIGGDVERHGRVLTIRGKP
ncbi:MAG: FecR family protein [Gemmatimonadales bacterium]